VRNVDGSVDAGRSATLASCVGLDHVSGVKNFREGGYLDLLDVSVPKLLDCIHLNSLLDDFKALDDDTDGGLVLHIDVDGPQAGTYNLYGVRLRDGAKLAADSPSAPAVRGLTIVSSQALYVQGSFNTVNKLPAALICDSINVLSNNWDDANSDLALSTRIATSTTINAAILTGTDTTGGIEGVGGQDLDEYNGGFENMIRLHEDWSGVPLRLRGSFVSLYTPQHVDGPFAAQSGQYNPPIRDWDYDTDFDVSANLPPLSPHFVYLRQELFVRRFSP